VAFSVTSGGGTVAGGSSATVTTDATGVATVSNWVINAGSNTVQAVGTYADPSVTFAAAPAGSDFPQAVTVDPIAGITYTATGGDIVPYGSSYTYFTGEHGADAGFESPTFSPDGWLTGSGAFGSVGSTSCPIFTDTDFPLRTNWPTSSDLLLRKTFTLPSGWSTPLTVSAAIDNDIIVYVNGHPLTLDASGAPLYSFPANSGYTFDSQTGFVTHENCAQRGELTFTVPGGYVHGGDNVLAIRARDRGSVNYVDVKVSVAVPR
jgi:hypothetical protein